MNTLKAVSLKLKAQQIIARKRDVTNETCLSPFDIGNSHDSSRAFAIVFQD